MKKIRTYHGAVFMSRWFKLINPPRAYGNNGLIAYLTPNGVLGFPFACDDVV
jgi:hypothetical protein